MADKKSYWEKLRDPRWQKKRLEILNRARFRCERCGDNENELHVHHGYYERGFDPWDYENETLWCLCGYCHEEVGKALVDINRTIALAGPDEIHFIFSRIQAAIRESANMEVPCQPS